MRTPARFPGGVTNASRTGPLAQFGLPDPTSWHVFFDDFDRFDAADWTISTTEAGTSAASEALGDGDGGVLVITNDDADDDADFLQKKGESFRFAAGRRCLFKARIKASDATQSDVIAGLVITDTTPLANSDGVYFIKSDGSAAVDLKVVKNGAASTAAAVAAMANDTWVELAFAYDGRAEVGCWVDGAKVASLGVSNLPDDEDLTVSFGIQNGSAGAKALSVDYLLAAKER